MGTYTEWGVDSFDSANQPSHGYSTLAYYVKYVYFYSPPPPDTINYWGRYFSPAVSGSTFGSYSGATNEISAMFSNSIYYVLPITSPPYVGASQSQGQTDGMTACQAIDNLIKGNSRISYPPNNTLYLYLDVETANGPLTTGYWKGWDDEVFGFISYNGSLPFYPGVYNSCASGACNIINSGDWASFVHIWANEPDAGCNGTYCSSPGPSWGPCTCSGRTTRQWQYGINPGTGTISCHCYTNFPPVDLDQGAPDTLFDHQYMLYLS